MADAHTDKGKGFVRDVIVGPGIIAFADIYAPKEKGTYGIGKFGLNFLFPKNDAATMKILIDAAVKAGQDMWGPKVEAKHLKIGVKDGDEKTYEGFPGHWYINPSSKSKPLIVGGDRQPLPEGILCKSGDTCRLCITVGAFKGALDKETADLLKAAGKVVMTEKKDDGAMTFYRPSVTFYLNMVQRLKGGTGFGAKANPNAFPAEEGGADFPAGDGPAAEEANPFG